MSSLQHGRSPRPEPTAADCRHSRQPFDTMFCAVAERRDLSDGAKLLHATLVSQHRTGYAWTQTELGRRIGSSRQKVWRLTAELVAAGLLLVRRRGLGLPNEYTLVGLDRESLDGSAPRFKAGHQEVRPRYTPARAVHYPKKETKERLYTPPQGGYLQTREGHYHEVVGRR